MQVDQQHTLKPSSLSARTALSTNKAAEDNKSQSTASKHDNSSVGSIRVSKVIINIIVSCKAYGVVCLFLVDL